MGDRIIGARLSSILNLHFSVYTHAKINRRHHHQNKCGPDDCELNRDGAFYALFRGEYELN